jgi:hypothetical protein
MEVMKQVKRPFSKGPEKAERWVAFFIIISFSIESKLSTLTFQLHAVNSLISSFFFVIQLIRNSFGNFLKIMRKTMVGRLDLAVRFVCGHQLSGRHILVIGYFRQSFDVIQKIFLQGETSERTSRTQWRGSKQHGMCIVYTVMVLDDGGAELGRTAI